MRRYFIAMLALILVSAAFVSCDKFEDGRPAGSVLSEFERMYPDAKDVEWEPDMLNWKVSFELGTPPDVTEHEAWYDRDGKWLRTESDILQNALPQVIKDALAASEYASAILSAGDIEYVETPEGNYYQLEVKYNGAEVKLKVTEDGDISLVGVDLF